MKKKKNMIPFAIVLTLGLFAFKPFHQQTGNALLLESASEINTSSFDDQGEEGFGTISTKLYVKPKPPQEDSLLTRRQDELLAIYHQ